uniref:C3H1-type domain-containing protein n=1 Tax=Arcella intermedia TaxID=1963864 RepID=A0A6B2LTZ7_9EUKA
MLFLFHILFLCSPHYMCTVQFHWDQMNSCHANINKEDILGHIEMNYRDKYHCRRIHHHKGLHGNLCNYSHNLPHKYLVYSHNNILRCH